MIKTKEDLQRVLQTERKLYIPQDGFLAVLKMAFLHDHDYLLWRYVKALRITEYYFNQNNKLMFRLTERRKNHLGASLGITIWHNCIDEGLKIYHYGSIMINGNAKIGKNCQLHGENCVGNKGNFDERAPILGDNIDMGVGAKVIGPIIVANGCRIGANAVVTKDFLEENSTLVGVPAHPINK